MPEKLKFTLKASLPVAVATILISFLTQKAALLFGIELPEQANIETVMKMIGMNLTFAFLVFQITVFMPVLEELIFRLFLFRLACPISAVFAAVASSALFSAAHYIKQPFPDSAFLALFFFGLAQCWIYRKTGSILYPMINHSLFNIINLVLLLAIWRFG